MLINQLVRVFVVYRDFSIDHNGDIEPIDSWVEGAGLYNMRTRIKEIDGKISWHQDAENLILKFNMPLN